MTQLPAPLVPEDCGLEGLSSSLMDWPRLRKSRLALLSKRRPEIGWPSLMLWGAAWSETPVASIEDDDDVLADRAMLSPERWAELKAEILRPWILCSNGRWYHPVVAEKANEQWSRRLRKRHELENARIRKKHKADGGYGEPPVIDFWRWLEAEYPASHLLRHVLFPEEAGQPVTGRPVDGEASATGERVGNEASVTGSVTEQNPEAGQPVTGRKTPDLALKGEGEGEGEYSSVPKGTVADATSRPGKRSKEELKAELYAEGVRILGEKNRWAVTNLLKACGGDLRKALYKLSDAEKQKDPLPWIVATTKAISPPNSDNFGGYGGTMM